MSTKTLQLESSTALRLYKTATGELKAILEESFGKDFFSQKITDRIKNFQDVLTTSLEWFNSVQGNTVEKVKTKIQKATHDILLNHVRGGRVTVEDRIKLISFVLNEGWEPDFTNTSQYKYYPYFQRKTSGWVVSGSYCVGDYAFVGSGCYFKSSELAMYAANTFLEIYKEYLPE